MFVFCGSTQIPIDLSLVCIGISISLATRKKIANNIKLVEEFVLEYIHLCIAKFGLLCWCPDFNQTAYSVYNSACCLITLNIFKQVLIYYAYDYFNSVTYYVQDITFMTKLYDHFVHYYMYEVFKMEYHCSGSVQEISEANPQYQNHKQVSIFLYFSYQSYIHRQLACRCTL